MIAQLTFFAAHPFDRGVEIKIRRAPSRAAARGWVLNVYPEKGLVEYRDLDTHLRLAPLECVRLARRRSQRRGAHE